MGCTGVMVDKSKLLEDIVKNHHKKVLVLNPKGTFILANFRRRIGNEMYALLKEKLVCVPSMLGQYVKINGSEYAFVVMGFERYEVGGVKLDDDSEGMHFLERLENLNQSTVVLTRCYKNRLCYPNKPKSGINTSVGDLVGGLSNVLVSSFDDSCDADCLYLVKCYHTGILQEKPSALEKTNL